VNECQTSAVIIYVMMCGYDLIHSRRSYEVLVTLMMRAGATYSAATDRIGSVELMNSYDDNDEPALLLLVSRSPRLLCLEILALVIYSRFGWWFAVHPSMPVRSQS